MMTYRDFLESVQSLLEPKETASSSLYTGWELHSYHHPLEPVDASIRYLTKRMTLFPAAAGSNTLSSTLTSDGDEKSMEYTLHSCWNDPDEEADLERVEIRQEETTCTNTSVHTPGGRPPRRVAVDVTYYVVYCPLYQVPVVYFDAVEFSDASSEAVRQRRATMRTICSVMPGVVDPLSEPAHEQQRHGFNGLIVSEGFCQPLNRSLFSVHPCDVEGILQACDEVLGPQKTTPGSASKVHLLLQMIGPALGMYHEDRGQRGVVPSATMDDEG